MVFSSLLFLFLFLPLVLVGNYLLPFRLRNFFLLLTSLFFYTWGENVYVLLMLLSITVNYAYGRFIHGAPFPLKRFLLATGVAVNLLPLLYYKYFEFFCESLEDLISLPAKSYEIHLPIGISFFTFQAISYLVDIYRNVAKPQNSIINLGLYISLFPQLIAGPIVRYGHIARQLTDRKVNSDLFGKGVERFIIGLSKKVLLANPLGSMADTIFALPAEALTTPVAWLGISSYTLQIYFDFSGYSDMAIGLGKMLGFSFPENFNRPYTALSLRDFWTRWHISLSTWFRDYLYIPLGGNKRGPARTVRNLCLVFLLCGLWHGASWNFLLWGMLHGFFLSVERTYFGTWLQQRSYIIRRLYVVLVVMFCWVFFRAETLTEATDFTAALAGTALSSDIPAKVLLGLTPHFLFVFICAALLATMPTGQTTRNLSARVTSVSPRVFSLTARLLSLFLLLGATTSSLATGVYNPFIYFRF